MLTQDAKRIRVGVAVLFLAATLLMVGTALRGTYVDPSSDAAKFATAANSGLFVPGWFMGMIAGVLILPGYQALYATMAHTREDRPAFWGMILCITCVALVMPLFGFMALGAVTVSTHYEQGRVEVMQVATAVLSSGPALTMLLLSGLLGIVGTLLSSVAIWRSGQLPRWSALPYALSGLLANIPVSYATELVGSAMFTFATGWIAWHKWRAGR